MGVSWGRFTNNIGPVLCSLGALLSYVELLWGPYWGILGPSWAVLGLSWASEGPSRGFLWALSGCFGLLLGQLSAVLRSLTTEKASILAICKDRTILPLGCSLGFGAQVFKKARHRKYELDTCAALPRSGVSSWCGVSRDQLEPKMECVNSLFFKFMIAARGRNA